jgi:hypothetical protein
MRPCVVVSRATAVRALRWRLDSALLCSALAIGTIATSDMQFITCRRDGLAVGGRPAPLAAHRPRQVGRIPGICGQNLPIRFYKSF